MPGRSGRFGRAGRLRKSREFRRVSVEGRRQAGPLAVVLVAPREPTLTTEGSGPRLGLTVSRKVGGAVVRNRVKRRVREWFRARRDRLLPGSDYVVIARSACGSSSYAALAAELERMCQVAGRDRG